MGNRKRRSRAQWQSLISDQAQSGLGVAEFCKQHGLGAKYFYRKRRLLQDAKALVPASESFIRVSPERSPSVPVENSVVLQHRESRLQMPVTTDPAWLARLLQSL
ncbi:MAG: IS66 family insertion sequence element accessory protein TnpB [Gammaproteobacteria bacterium]|nr:IS66 family insertion sequence element accessory protein TnpB [Gammaproteobacteria bacterium]